MSNNTVCCGKDHSSSIRTNPLMKFHKISYVPKQLNPLMPPDKTQETCYKVLRISEDLTEPLAQEKNKFVCSQQFSQDDYYTLDSSKCKRKLKANEVTSVNFPSSLGTNNQGNIHLSNPSENKKPEEHYPYVKPFLQEDQLLDHGKDMYRNVNKCFKMIEISNNKPQEVDNRQYQMPQLEPELQTSNTDNQENISPPNLLLEESPNTEANNALLLIVKEAIDSQPQRLIHLCEQMNNFDKKLKLIDDTLNKFVELLDELD